MVDQNCNWRHFPGSIFAGRTRRYRIAGPSPSKPSVCGKKSEHHFCTYGGVFSFSVSRSTTPWLLSDTAHIEGALRELSECRSVNEASLFHHQCCYNELAETL